MSGVSIGPIVSAIGSGISGFFGFKGQQAEVISQAMGVVGDVNRSDNERAASAAQVIYAEATSSSWLARNWRPLMMTFFAILVGARWFGYTPPNMSPAELIEVYNLLQIGMGGYIGGRSLEKIVQSLNLGKTLQKFIEKKIG